MTGIGTAGVLTDGFLLRHDPEDKALASLETTAVQAYHERVFKAHRLVPLSKGKTKVLVVGDSYGQDWVNALDAHGIWDSVSLSTFHMDVFCRNLWTQEPLDEVVTESKRAHCARHPKYADPVLQEHMREAGWIFWHPARRVGMSRTFR